MTPWPPDWSGVAEYNRRLTRALANRVDVDVVTADPVRGYSIPVERGVRLVAAGERALFAGLRRYDRIVYCMGNSRFHAHVFELLVARPDAVVFHDVQLTGFFGAIAGHERPEDPSGALVARIQAMYPDLATTLAEADGAQRPAPAMFMTRGIQRYANQCFVHSRSALEMLAFDRGSLDRHAPATILPYGLPEVADWARVRGEASSTPMIISLGAVAEVKGIAKLIRAFALLAAVYPAARLVIAGSPAEQADSTRWHEYARKHAPKGIPTLVTDLGWAGELPAEVVARVPVKASATLIMRRLEELLVDPQRRSAISAAVLDHARSHSIARAADAYVEALELA